ncbi:MAG: hypothetical protein PVJ67_01340 [Candidatus Pacearchaeota archaeon]|jgi:hypothetical protein
MRRSILEKKKNNDRRNQIILGVILVIVMFISVAGYAFSGGSKTESSSEKVTYNGFEFINQNGYWFLELGNYNFYFSYNPGEVERISGEINLLNSYSGKPLYIYSEDGFASSEIYRNLFYNTRIVQRTQSACLEEDCDENSPIKTCEDNFIIIKKAEEVKITQEDNCVFIEGPEGNLTQIADEFLFKIMNID